MIDVEPLHIVSQAVIEEFSMLQVGNDVTSLISGYIIGSLTNISPLAAVVIFVVGVVAGSYNAGKIGQYVSSGDPWRAKEFQKIEENISDEMNEEIEGKAIVSRLATDEEPTQGGPTSRRYEDFIHEVYESLYDEEGNVSETEEKISQIRENLDQIQFGWGESDDLRKIVSEVRGEGNYFEPNRSTLVTNFFVDLENYLRNSTVTDEDMKGLLKRVGKVLDETTNKREEYKNLKQSLQAYDLSNDDIPNEPQWDSLFNDLGIEDEYGVAVEIQKLVSILQMYERELTATRSIQSDQQADVAVLEALRTNLSKEWIERNVGSTDEDPLVVAAREGILGPRIISTAAASIIEDEKLGDSEFLETLADESPSNEDEIKDTLKHATESIRKYETIQLQFEEIDHEELEPRLEEIKTQISTMDSPIRSGILNEHLDYVADEIERISSTNQLELYATATQLNYIERAVTTHEDTSDYRSMDTIIDKIDQKREEVDELLTPGKYGINTGHTITEEFVSLADEFREKAQEAIESGEATHAQIYLINCQRILETVEYMYDNRDLREKLQHI